MLPLIADGMQPAQAVRQVEVRQVGTVSVGIPEVAATATDGLAAVLRPGVTRVDVAVLLNPHADERLARLEVNGAACPWVALPPGSVVRLPCLFQAAPHARVTVRAVAGDTVVATWQHTVR